MKEIIMAHIYVRNRVLSLRKKKKKKSVKCSGLPIKEEGMENL